MSSDTVNHSDAESAQSQNPQEEVATENTTPQNNVGPRGVDAGDTDAGAVSSDQEAHTAVAEEEPVAVTAPADDAPLEHIAMVLGKPLVELPKDLYIPPQALEVFLEAFEGPLDLLLYLIKRQNLDILNIPIAEITRQYMEYIGMMQDMHFELAAEYLLMAAMLAEIKSRMLLPRPVSEDEDEEDPRAELVRRLQEYERFKKAAEDIDTLPRMNRDNFKVEIQAPDFERKKVQPSVDLKEILLAFKDVLTRVEMNSHHRIELEPLSVRERMSEVLSKVERGKFTPFIQLFRFDEGRIGVVVTFLAVLELVKESSLDLVQTEPYGPIHVTVAESCQQATTNS